MCSRRMRSGLRGSGGRSVRSMPRTPRLRCEDMTADNDLTRPLGLTRERRRFGGRIALAVAGMLFLGIIAGAGTFAWLQFSPLGEAPGVVTVTAVDRTIETGSTVEDVYSGLVEVRPDGGLSDIRGVVIHDPSEKRSVELAALPEAGLIEPGAYGPLPKVSPTGLRPLDAYARPLTSQGRADRIAIIIGGVGISAQTTTSAMRDLPGEVTLALAPYGDSLDATVREARAIGHELLLQVPMEPFNYPSNDPGPQTLTVAASDAVNIDNLHWAMAQATNYIGVVNYLGARFTTERAALDPIVSEIGRRGLVYVDDGSSARSAAAEAARGVTPFLRADVVLDADLTAAAIDARLEQLQAIARERGFAIAIGTAFPITIDRVAAFARGAEARGIELVPLSALALAGRG